MTLFLDASAIVAMIAGEPERDRFRDLVAQDGNLLWSAMSCWETVSAIRKLGDLTVDGARDEVERTTMPLRLRLVPIGQHELTVALDAYRTYGRNSGNPARLNFGDCFAYACAKTNNARLLYKGDDFARTDLA